MTQIIEFTKHSNKYLIHHFAFECNDNTTFGRFAGNSSLNKFMSLHDWKQIFDDLSESIQNYTANPNIQPVSSKRTIVDTNFQLDIIWAELDASFYSKLFETIDFSCVFPYVIKVYVSLRSNIDKFFSNESVKTPVRPKLTINQDALNIRESNSNQPVNKKQIYKNNNVLKENDNPEKFVLKECRVILPLLEFDENGQVIEKNGNNRIRKKRKHSSLADGDDVQLMSNNRHVVSNDGFMYANSSTPFVRNVDLALKQIENDVGGTFGKTKKRLTNRLTTTPRTSYDRKTGSPFNPRIRLLKMPENINKAKPPKRSKERKKVIKLNGKEKKLPVKKMKPKVRSVSNESELFETPKQKPKEEKLKKAKNKPKPKSKLKPKSTPKSLIDSNDIIKLEEFDLKSLTADDLWKSFDNHYSVVSSLFSKYLKQTDTTVQRAGDYNHFDVLSQLTTDQFSVMLDILFDKLVKIGEFGDINYDALFLELLIPEWVLAIFMQGNSLDRKTAIERIKSQKTDQSDQNQSEAYATLISIRLDDTINSTKMSKNITADSQ